MIEARAYWATAPAHGEIRRSQLAAPRTATDCPDVLVETLFSGISRGSEQLVAAGRVPVSQHEVMRCPFQEGAFLFPVKYGYCNVGEVVAGRQDLVGSKVFCLYPHQTQYVVPADAVRPLPSGLEPRRAVLAANMETALNAVWDAALLPGERIRVLGAGVVGCLIARLASQLPGAEVTLIDIDAGKAAVADALGVAFATSLDQLEPADCVVNATASSSALEAALSAAGMEARIVEVSWYGDRNVPLPLGEAFHSRRLRLISSQVGQVSPALRPRFDHARRMAKALDLLAADDKLEVLLDGESAFDELPTVMPTLAERPMLCHVVRYQR